MHTTIEQLSLEACAQAEKEVGALIGTELEFTLQSASLVKKQGFLEHISGRNTIIGLQMRGRYDGDGCLVVAEDCAVRLAGKMLMLPSTELNDIITRGSYSDEEEISYAFEDIAKSLVISFLHTFQSESVFISTVSCQAQKWAEGKKEIAEILSHLSAEHTFYAVRSAVTMAGVTSQALSLLFPAFVLVCSEPFRTQAAKELNLDSSAQEASGHEQIDRTSLAASDDVLFPHLRPPLQKELSSLLGITVQIREKTGFSGPISELLQGSDARSRLAVRILISGAAHRPGWLVVPTREAMKLGLLLTDGIPGIMIPGSLTGEFNVDCQDGFQEICSIIIDVVDSVCNDLSGGELFMEKGAPADADGPDSFPEGLLGSDEQIFRQTSLELVADTLVCGIVHILLPEEVYEILDAAPPAHTEEETADSGEDANEPPDLAAAAPQSIPADSLHAVESILFIGGDSSDHSAELLNSLDRAGMRTARVAAADDVGAADLDSHRAVLLVLEKVDEIGFGAVIKIKSASSVPLLVAAPSWTQSEVMKALRYGVDDIIMLPSPADELVDKLRRTKPSLG